MATKKKSYPKLPSDRQQAYDLVDTLITSPNAEKRAVGDSLLNLLRRTDPPNIIAIPRPVEQSLNAAQDIERGHYDDYNAKLQRQPDYTAKERAQKFAELVNIPLIKDVLTPEKMAGIRDNMLADLGKDREQADSALSWLRNQPFDEYPGLTVDLAHKYDEYKFEQADKGRIADPIGKWLESQKPRDGLFGVSAAPGYRIDYGAGEHIDKLDAMPPHRTATGAMFHYDEERRAAERDIQLQQRLEAEREALLRQQKTNAEVDAMLQQSFPPAVRPASYSIGAWADNDTMSMQAAQRTAHEVINANYCFARDVLTQVMQIRGRLQGAPDYDPRGNATTTIMSTLISTESALDETMKHLREIMNWIDGGVK